MPLIGLLYVELECEAYRSVTLAVLHCVLAFHCCLKRSADQQQQHALHVANRTEATRT